MSNLAIKKCYKCKKSLIDNLNIAFNISNLTIILWNKFQIFIYENINFNEDVKTIIPDFQINLLIQCNKYLACLDTDGNIYVDVLKFKNNAPKRFKSLPKVKHNILSIITYNTDSLLCLKLKANKFTLCLHRFDIDFQMLQETLLLYDTEQWPIELDTKGENVILYSCIICLNNYKSLKNIFKLPEDISSEHSLVIISFDKKTVYACIFKPKMEDTFMIKLHTCPSEISNFEIVNLDNLYVIIALKSGTLIKLSLMNIDELQIIHLNTAINKLLCSTDTVVYTDGLTMWKSEKTYSNDIKLTKLFVTQVKDFIILNDKLICTTFTKLIYVFQIDNEECFINTNTEKYCPASKVLNDAQCLQNIFDEIERNSSLVKKINEEEHYISILSLSNRQDVMDRVINTNVMVYESYEEAVKQTAQLTLTEKLSKYFGKDTIIILAKICTDPNHQMYDQIFSNLLDNIKINMTFSTENKIIKSYSIKLVEQLKKLNYLMPLETKSNKIYVLINIVTNIPGAYDEKQSVWNVLYEKKVLLNSEHFIKTEQNNRNIFLKKSEKCITDLILETVGHQYGDVFNFIENANSTQFKNKLSFYVKLPKNYKEILKTDDYCKKMFSLKKTAFLLQKYSCEEFLNSKNNISFLIGEDKVTVEILNDNFCSPMLKIFSDNITIAFDIRNFFANILYEEFKSQSTGEECIKHTFYTVVENHRKTMKDCIVAPNIDELEQQIAYFERNIIGNLPM